MKLKAIEAVGLVLAIVNFIAAGYLLAGPQSKYSQPLGALLFLLGAAVSVAIAWGRKLEPKKPKY